MTDTDGGRAMTNPDQPDAVHLIGERTTLTSLDRADYGGTVTGVIAAVEPGPPGETYAVAVYETGHRARLPWSLIESTRPEPVSGGQPQPDRLDIQEVDGALVCGEACPGHHSVTDTACPQPHPDTTHGVWEGTLAGIQGFIRGPLARGAGDPDAVLLATCPDAATADRIVEALSAVDAEQPQPDTNPTPKDTDLSRELPEWERKAMSRAVVALLAAFPGTPCPAQAAYAVIRAAAPVIRAAVRGEPRANPDIEETDGALMCNGDTCPGHGTTRDNSCRPPLIADWFARDAAGETVRVVGVRGNDGREVLRGTFLGYADRPQVVIKVAPGTRVLWDAELVREVDTDPEADVVRGEPQTPQPDGQMLAELTRLPRRVDMLGSLLRVTRTSVDDMAKALDDTDRHITRLRTEVGAGDPVLDRLRAVMSREEKRRG